MIKVVPPPDLSQIIYLITYVLVCLLTYLLTPRNRVLLENLTGSQLGKKFPALEGNQNVFNRVYKSTPSVPIPSHNNPVHVPHSTYRRSILILSSYLSLGVQNGVSRFPTKKLYAVLLYLYVPHGQPI